MTSKNANITTIEDAAAVLALAGVRGTGRKTLHRLLRALRHAGVTPARVLETAPSELARAGMDPALLAPVAECGAKLRKDALKTIELALERNMRAIAAGMADYPKALLECLGDNAPPLLFVRGNAELLHKQRTGGVVGTRAPSGRGIRTARDCATLIVREGHTVVSGGAQGVDSAAHDAALAAGGATVCALPQGLFTHTPPPHWEKALEEDRMAFCAEVHPAAPWQGPAAVARNRIIAALSRVVCVIEPRKTGGSIETARQALAQGKPVFASGHSRLPAGLLAELRSLYRQNTFDETALAGALRSAGARPVGKTGDLFDG